MLKQTKKLTNRLSLRTVKTKFYYICNLMMWMQISFVMWAALNTLHVTRLPSPFWKLWQVIIYLNPAQVWDSQGLNLSMTRFSPLTKAFFFLSSQQLLNILIFHLVQKSNTFPFASSLSTHNNDSTEQSLGCYSSSTHLLYSCIVRRDTAIST